MDLSYLVVMTPMINLALGGARVQSLAQSWGTDPINFSLCTIAVMGNFGLTNLFHRLSISVSLIASCCWDHLTAQLSLLRRSPNKSFKAQLPFQNSRGGAGCAVAASLSNSFSLWVDSREDQWVLLPEQMANWGMRWWFYSDGIPQSLYSLGLWEEKEAPGEERELFFTRQQNLQASEAFKSCPPVFLALSFYGFGGGGW